MSDDVQVGRVAFRVEGQYYNAYWALRDTMEGAIHIASVKIAPLRCNDALRTQFVELVQNIVSDAFDKTMGARPSAWTKESAPEHERSGNA